MFQDLKFFVFSNGSNCDIVWMLYQVRPELHKEKGKSFLVKLMQNLALTHVDRLTLLVENVLFPESLG